MRTDPLSTLPGATSGDVHTGLGKPIQGQTASDTSTSAKGTSGTEGIGASGGSGLQGSGPMSSEFRRLQDDRDQADGPIKEHNQSLTGAEGVQGETADFVAADSGKSGVHASGAGGGSKETSGVSNRGAGAPRE